MENGSAQHIAAASVFFLAVAGGALPPADGQWPDLTIYEHCERPTQTTLYPGFAGFTLKRRMGHFPGYFIKRGTLGGLFFNVPPVCEKRGTLGGLFFNVPPVCEKRGTLKISTPNVPRFSQKRGDIEKQSSQCPTFYEIIFNNYKSIKPT